MPTSNSSTSTGRRVGWGAAVAASAAATSGSAVGGTAVGWRVGKGVLVGTMTARAAPGFVATGSATLLRPGFALVDALSRPDAARNTAAVQAPIKIVTRVQTMAKPRTCLRTVLVRAMSVLDRAFAYTES